MVSTVQLLDGGFNHVLIFTHKPWGNEIQTQVYSENTRKGFIQETSMPITKHSIHWEIYIYFLNLLVWIMVHFPASYVSLPGIVSITPSTMQPWGWHQIREKKWDTISAIASDSWVRFTLYDCQPPLFGRCLSKASTDLSTLWQPCRCKDPCKTTGISLHFGWEPLAEETSEKAKSQASCQSGIGEVVTLVNHKKGACAVFLR